MRTKFLLLINMISDIDECDKGTHSCSFNAVCNNTKGSYNCTCKPGYEEDGDNCKGIFFFQFGHFARQRIETKPLPLLFFHDKMVFKVIIC